MVTIREARKEDLPALKAMDNFGDQLNKYSGLDKLDPDSEDDEARSTSYYEEFMNEDDKWCYVAEDNGSILGFLLFKIEKREEYYRVKQVGYIDFLYVSENARGKGISKQLMETAKKMLKEKELHYLKLSVHVDNPAREVWKKHGFKEYRVDMYKEI
ncbi:MAG: N-acetyltransferase family protein [Nanobdellota archaeon]